MSKKRYPRLIKWYDYLTIPVIILLILLIELPQELCTRRMLRKLKEYNG